MSTATYDPRFAVECAWSLEFQPVNISAVFFQRGPGNQVSCIASQSDMFTSLADAVGKLSIYPWRVRVHLLSRPDRTDDAPIAWGELFEQQGLSAYDWPRWADIGIRTAYTNALLSRLIIDTQPRPWAEKGNNAALVDSLNGYRARETGHNEFSTSLEPSWEHWLVRAVETYAVWEHDSAAEWSRPPSYETADRIYKVRRHD